MRHVWIWRWERTFLTYDGGADLSRTRDRLRHVRLMYESRTLVLEAQWMHALPYYLDMYKVQPKLQLPVSAFLFFNHLLLGTVLLVLLSCLITAVHYFGLFESVVQQWDNKVEVSQILWMDCTRGPSGLHWPSFVSSHTYF